MEEGGPVNCGACPWVVDYLINGFSKFQRAQLVCEGLETRCNPWRQRFGHKWKSRIHIRIIARIGKPNSQPFDDQCNYQHQRGLATPPILSEAHARGIDLVEFTHFQKEKLKHAERPLNFARLIGGIEPKSIAEQPARPARAHFTGLCPAPGAAGWFPSSSSSSSSS